MHDDYEDTGDDFADDRPSKSQLKRDMDALQDLADKAQKHGLIIGIENEHACNIATAQETARVLAAIDHENLQVVWDPANAYISGEKPYPNGYRLLDATRIGHVHVKDCRLTVDANGAHKPLWGAVGTCDIDWKGQIEALAADGYRGYLHLETHWPGPDGNKFEGSKICGQNLNKLAGN